MDWSLTLSGSLLLFIVQLFYSIVLKDIVKQEWKSSKKTLVVQCVIKQPFCLGFLLIVAPSNCHHRKHEQGVEFGCLTMILQPLWVWMKCIWRNLWWKTQISPSASSYTLCFTGPQSNQNKIHHINYWTIWKISYLVQYSFVFLCRIQAIWESYIFHC